MNTHVVHIGSEREEIGRNYLNNLNGDSMGEYEDGNDEDKNASEVNKRKLENT